MLLLLALGLKGLLGLNKIFSNRNTLTVSALARHNRWFINLFFRVRNTKRIFRIWTSIIMTKIKINNVELYAYHGVSLEEKNLGGKFSYDLEITFDISKASQTDNIEDTIDYAFMINLVSEFILVNKFNLLEKLVVEICKLVIYKFQNIQK